jgi:hypothetical protein
MRRWHIILYEKGEKRRSNPALREDDQQEMDENVLPETVLWCLDEPLLVARVGSSSRAPSLFNDPCSRLILPHVQAVACL